MKVIRKVSKRIYIHKDLSSVALHLRQNIERNMQVDGYKGMALELVSCLAMLAFSNEAKINFVGQKVISDWNERSGFYDKLKVICKRLGFKPDIETRPYKTISDLHGLRNILAHGKPIIMDVEDEVALDQHDFDALIDLKAEWERNINYDFLVMCFDDSKEIWETWLKLSGIDRAEAITFAEVSAELVEN